MPLNPNEFEEASYEQVMGLASKNIVSPEYLAWKAKIENETGLADLDDPRHKYDYRAAYAAGIRGPDKSGHWPSRFKAQDHPNRYVDGVDTIGQSTPKGFEEVDLFKLPEAAPVEKGPKKGYWATAAEKGKEAGESFVAEQERQWEAMKFGGQRLYQWLNTAKVPQQGLWGRGAPGMYTTIDQELKDTVLEWTKEPSPEHSIFSKSWFRDTLGDSLLKTPFRVGVFFANQLPNDIKSIIGQDWKKESEKVHEASNDILPGEMQMMDNPLVEGLARAVFKNVAGLANVVTLPTLGLEFKVPPGFLGPEEMPSVIERAKRAFVTPGIGFPDIQDQGLVEWSWRNFRGIWERDPGGAILGLLMLRGLYKQGKTAIAERVPGLDMTPEESALWEGGAPLGRSPVFEELARQKAAVNSLGVYKQWKERMEAGVAAEAAKAGKGTVTEVLEKEREKKAKKKEPTIQPYEKPFEEIEVEKGVKYWKSPIENIYRSKTGAPWKTRAATMVTRGNIERVEGIETVPVELPGGGWFLAEKEYAKSEGWIQDLKEAKGSVPSQKEVEEAKTETAEEKARIATEEIISKPVRESLIEEGFTPEEAERIERQGKEALDEKEEALQQELDDVIEPELTAEEGEARLRPTKLEDWIFYEDKETTLSKDAEIYNNPKTKKTIESDIELYHMKLVHDVTKFIHGLGGDIAQLRRDLSYIAAHVNDFRMTFIEPENFFQFKLRAQEAAEYARIATQLEQTKLFSGLPIDEKLAKSISDKINKRISYGMRTEVAEADGYKAMWSDSAADWAVAWGRPVKKGETVQLDANQILVPKKGIRSIDAWFKSGETPVLPLYRGSFEYSKQGKRAAGPEQVVSTEAIKRGKEGPSYLGEIEQARAEAEAEVERFKTLTLARLEKELATEKAKEAPNILTIMRLKDRIARVKEAETKLYAGLPIDAQKVKELYDEVSKLKQTRSEHKPVQVVDLFKDGFLDYNAKARNELYKMATEGHPIAYATANEFALARGATGEAARQFKQFEKEVLRGLSRREEEILGFVQSSMRSIEVTKPGYPTTAQRKSILRPMGLDYKAHQVYLDNLAELEGISSERAELIKAKAKAFFDWGRELLTFAKERELITPELFDELIKFNYSRSELIDKIDPYVTGRNPFGGQPIKVRSSGIDYLARGKKEDLLETDARYLMADLIFRTHARAAKNAPNRMLWELSGEIVDNPLVKRWEVERVRKGIDEATGEKVTYEPLPRKPKAPEHGWTVVDAFVDGEKRYMAMPTEMANAWNLNRHEVSQYMANFARIASGSFIMRPLATTFNLGFALSNMLLDMFSIWHSAGIMINGKWEPVYSPHLPVFATQMAKDLITVAPDVWMRRGKYEDLVKNGGSMEWLIMRQGAPTARGEAFRLPGEVEKGFNKVFDTMAYLTGTSELWTRTALNERSLIRIAKRDEVRLEEARTDTKIGGRAREAAAISRLYLDFNQGGAIAKALDPWLPFFNAGIQVARGPIRAAMRDWQSASIRAAWTIGMGAGLYLANRFMNPKGTAAIRDENSTNYWILTLPDDMRGEDEFGEPFYPHLRVRKEQFGMFFSKVGETIAKVLVGDEVNGTEVARSFKNLVTPLDLGSMPPSLQALGGYVMNKDWWTLDNIYKGPDQTEPWAEMTKTTHPAFRRIGELTSRVNEKGERVGGLSPERTRFVLEKIFTRGNLFTYGVGYGWKQAFGKLPQDYQQVPLALSLSREPEIGKFVGVARPGQKYATEVDDIRSIGAAKRSYENLALDEVTELYFNKQVTMEEVRKVIKQFPDSSTQERLIDRFIMNTDLRSVPSETRRWITTIAQLPPEERAEAFVIRWNKADEEQKALIRQSIGLLGQTFSGKTEGGKRFWSRVGELSRKKSMD